MSDRKVVGKREKHILCSITFFSENRAVYEIMWKTMAQPDKTTDVSMSHVLGMLDS